MKVQKNGEIYKSVFVDFLFLKYVCRPCFYKMSCEI